MASPRVAESLASWEGAVVMLGATELGRVRSVVRDPISRRVRRLVTSYCDRTGASREVAIPIEWVVQHQPGRVVLGVERHELDGLFTYADPAMTWRPGALEQESSAIEATGSAARARGRQAVGHHGVYRLASGDQDPWLSRARSRMALWLHPGGGHP